MTKEKIGIIDLGTNTFHLMLVEIDERENYVVKGRYKEPVKLGEGGFDSGKITDEAFARGIRALKTFRTLLNTHAVTKILAYATSAIRSSSNGKAFIQSAKEEADIPIKIINGNEEASIIFEGVKNGVQLPFEQRVLVMDIGGGSVEFIVAHEGRAELLRSINIGGARMLEKINPSNPITPKETQQLHKLFDKELAPLLKELKEFDLNLLVGSSGTCETLGTLVAHAKKDKFSAININGYKFLASEYDPVIANLITTTRSERLKMEGVDATRAEMIVLGGILVQYILKELKLGEMMICTHALKEGILHRYLRDKTTRIAKYMGQTQSNLRARAILGLSLKYHYEQDHVLKVSELATRIFEQLSPLHEYGTMEKEWLQYACILHDIGKFIHVNSHHKHGQYIIANSQLSGFNTNELMLISTVVRYHRRAHPKPDHIPFNSFTPLERKLVSFLSGILRIADNLDRGHREYVTGITLNIASEKITLEVHAMHDIGMELQSATDNKELLELVLNKPIELIAKS